MFPYGSVPLKTYLLDGDIDLTALCSPSVEEDLASDVHAVLKAEEQNENAEFEVKDIQFITAEVFFLHIGAFAIKDCSPASLMFRPCLYCLLVISRIC